MPKTEKPVEKQNKPWQFQPGQSGNPAGKPKGIRHMSTLLLEAVKRVAQDGGTSEDVEIVRALVAKAKSGDTKAIDIVFDRLEGKAPQTIDVTTDGDKLPSAGEVDISLLALKMAEELKKKKT